MFLLSPLDTIRPSDLLAQYSEWVYFTLLLIFFISLTGLALRKHFDRAYAKPLIVAVGLMMTAGTFMWKDMLTILFEGWGIIGTLLLVFIVATIPYALCRGFGMSGQRAFFVVYALFYLLSWMKFPFIYSYLGNNNMGLVNLALLVLFIYSVYKILAGWKSSSDLASGFSKKNPLTKEISEEIDIQNQESKVIRQQENRFTRLEVKSISDMEESLVEIIRIIQADNANLTTKDRESISNKLKKISNSEDIFLKTIQNLKKILRRLSVLDDRQLMEMKNRFQKSVGKEKEELQKEIYLEEQKIETDQNVIVLERDLEKRVNRFNDLIRQSIRTLNGSQYPADAVEALSGAMATLKDVVGIVDKMKHLEDKLFQLSRKEEKLLKKEEKET